MATKKKRSPLRDASGWVVVAADSVVGAPEEGAGDPTFARLRNPSSGGASLYLFGGGDAQVYEVKAFAEDHRSWFVGETVQRDGRLLFITPMDPLYLLLPYIQEAGAEGKFQPANQVVTDEDFPGCSRLLRCTCALESLRLVADEKEVANQRFYRYNQQKTLDWLKRKVERTVSVLKRSDVSVGGGVKSATYVRVKSEVDASDEDYLRYAHGLVSEYVSEDLSKELLRHLQLPEISSPKEEPPSKPQKKMTVAQKSLAKVDKSGMRPMSAFFGPKVKQEKK
uniref:Ribonuclease H2 subunit B n=1 Tax=Denticeps clupeoides TaxID=299321 RepID=A0AAY4BH68_9TELE